MHVAVNFGDLAHIHILGDVGDGINNVTLFIVTLWRCLSGGLTKPVTPH